MSAPVRGQGRLLAGHLSRTGRGGSRREEVRQRVRPAGQFELPHGVTWRDGRLYVSDRFNDRVQVLDRDGGFVEQLSARWPNSVSRHPGWRKPSAPR